jgi:hypothetical protein
MQAPAATGTPEPGGLFQRALGRVAAIPERLHRGLGYHVGPVAVNRLGFQVFRAVYKNVGWHLRKQPITDETRPYVEALVRDGCVVIPDFFPPDVFAAIQEEHERGLREFPYQPYMLEDNGVEESMLDLTGRRAAYSTLWNGLVENQFVRAIIAGALRRPISVRPRLWLRRSRKLETYGKPFGPGHVVGANYPHADMHYPTFKGFFYFRDVDESNGAFQFALGSHRMTLGRIMYEYDASIRVARGRRSGGWKEKSYALVRLPTDAQSRRLGGLHCTPMVGKANSLVLANTQGFHRQGEFQPGTTREVACLCFRSSEPGGHVLVGTD